MNVGNLGNFDAREVEPAGDFSPLPEGEYIAAITGSEMKPTKSGTGKYLELSFQVLEGEWSGRLLWSRLNLDNPNEQAVKIARGELSAICRATNVLTPTDSSDLHDRPLTIKVVVRTRNDTGEPTNEIKAYRARTSSTPAAKPGGKPW